eukprot:TRINITY_DN50664_c0_g1_i1.p1 TRINITY_DN50664_c0_g1~~TRINITY_DN50664_c0_g1_i1.p1  ORF type:complete len:471 (+),score=93.67 TRINITY_DN50664_c0_g1_i1:129-1541(+)
MATGAAAEFMSLLASGGLAEQISSGAFDAEIKAMELRRKQLTWSRLPDRVIVLRHGESEGNVDHSIYTSKGDSLLELTDTGLQQARDAGARLAKVVGDSRVFVAVSPFERAIQTLYGLYQGGFPRSQVGVVHHDPRIREQEFGNFQNPGLTATVRAEEAKVGRFYYRRPNAESSADVFDRVSGFWEALLSDGPTSLLLQREQTYDTCLLVTHGLTIRLMLMVIYQWSVDTFESVYNLGNCNHYTLRKNPQKCCYELCPDESYPQEFPWATRNVFIRLNSLQPSEDTATKLARLKDFKQSKECSMLGQLMSTSTASQDNMLLRRTPSRYEEVVEEGHSWSEVDRVIAELEEKEATECSRAYTVVDYLTVTPPRSMRTEQLLERLVPGHNLRSTRADLMERAKQMPVALEDVHSINFWGDKVSFKGKQLHMEMDCAKLVSKQLDVTPGGRVGNLSEGWCGRLNSGDFDDETL